MLISLNRRQQMNEGAGFPGHPERDPLEGQCSKHQVQISLSGRWSMVDNLGLRRTINLVPQEFLCLLIGNPIA